jgi:hypothetical protein
MNVARGAVYRACLNAKVATLRLILVDAIEVTNERAAPRREKRVRRGPSGWMSGGRPCLASAAERLGVSQGTLRGALKTIFRETGAKRQAEFVGLLTRIDF